MSDPRGFYHVLGLEPNAGASDIKESYRIEAKKWHPDHNKSANAMERFQLISVAYEILSNDKNKIMYDLLSQVYSADKFPDMFSLKVYKNQKDREDTSIRAIHLKQVVGKIKTAEVTENTFICNFSEAEIKVLQNHFNNWLLGWWGIRAFKENIKAIKENYTNMGLNFADNLQLLVHNIFAYEAEGKKEKSYATALQALQYANSEQKDLVNKYINILGVEGNPRTSRWNWLILKYLQLLIPGLIILLLILQSISNFIKRSEINQYWLDRSTINYYREVINEGQQSSTDDWIVSKIVNLPPDTSDTTLLYHVTGFANVMYGPSEKFEIYTRLGRGHTVRLTGYSPDKVWARIMLDSGDSGFIKMDQLKPGPKNKIPEDSKIFTGYISDDE